MGSQRYQQHLGATTVLQTTVAAVSIIANQPLTNRAGHPFSSTVAETLMGGGGGGHVCIHRMYLGTGRSCL